MVKREYMDLKVDGRIILFLRSEAKNPRYYVPLKIPNSKGYKTVSTKTNNLVDRSEDLPGSSMMNFIIR